MLKAPIQYLKNVRKLNMKKTKKSSFLNLEIG